MLSLPLWKVKKEKEIRDRIISPQADYPERGCGFRGKGGADRLLLRLEGRNLQVCFRELQTRDREHGARSEVTER